MRKFKFKLDGVLKVREFEEQKIKIELGKILRELNVVEEQIEKANQDINEAYEAQEASMRNESVTAQMLQFFPMFVAGKKEDIKNKENLRFALKKKYDQRLAELSKARGEVKIMENFKDKKKGEWTKEKNKKEQEAIEEILMMRINGSKGAL